MSKGDRNAPPATQPLPDEPMEVGWDDDTVPSIDLDDAAFDRVTAIPELPPEVMAKSMMDSNPPDLSSGLYGRADPASEPAAVSSTRSPVPFELEGAVLPHDAPVRAPSAPPLSIATVSTAPPPTRAAGHQDYNAQPELEVDESVLNSAIAARGRWAKPEPVVQRRGSLELDLSGFESAPPRPAPDPALRALADRYATGDYSGALIVAEGLLETTPDHAEALRYAQNCRDVLTQMYSARLGALDQVVGVAIPNDQIRWLSLDHRAGFLLSLVDGTSSVEELLDISGMPRLDALRIFYSLLQEQVISLTPR